MDAYKEFDDEPLFVLLCSYFNNDRERAAREVLPLIDEGHSLKDACDIVINSHGFERSFD